MNDKDEHTKPDAAQKFLQRIQEESKVWEAEGRDSWSALVRLRGKALPQGDEIVLAKRLYLELPLLKKALKVKGLRLGEFCQLANLGNEDSYSKELHRMILAPGKDHTSVRLRRSAAKYRALLSAMANVLDQSCSALANRMLVGTSLHPANGNIRDEVDLVQSMLQTIVDTVDEKFGLFAVFKETAQLKALHALDRGSCRWPHYEEDYRVGAYEDEMRWKNVECVNGNFIVPLVVEDSDNDQIMKVAASRAEHNDAKDVSRAYWQVSLSKKHCSSDNWTQAWGQSGCLQDDEFFYVPHAYFGYVGWDWQGISPDLTPVEHNSILDEQGKHVMALFAQYGAVPSDVWNDTEQRPHGQTTSMDHGMANWHAWIVVYPSPDNTRLMPMLFIPGEEGGAMLLPLDSVMLYSLRHHYWFGPDGECATFLERIKQLIGFGPQQSRVILDALQKTSPWLKKNPFMKMKDANRNEHELMQAFCRDLVRDLGDPDNGRQP